MRILPKYLLREFVKLLGVCLTVFVAIYLVVDFLQRVDDFMEARVLSAEMFLYFLYKVPFILVHMSPVAALISVIILFSGMQRSNEITALKASGVSVLRFSAPLIAASLVMAAAVFVFSELVVPYASSQSQSIWLKEVKKRDPKRFYGKNHIWYKGERAIYWIRHFDGQTLTMLDPTFYFMDEAFRLAMKVRGERARWNGKTWSVEQGSMQAAEAGGEYTFRTFEELDLELPETPETFTRTVRRPEEMGYWELRRFAERIREEGYDATPYRVDTHIKLAFPIINFIMVLVGIPIALTRRRGGTPLSVSIGVCVCFLYLLALGVARSFGLSGTLPPPLAAWFANLLFLFIGIQLMMRVEA